MQAVLAIATPGAAAVHASMCGIPAHASMYAGFPQREGSYRPYFVIQAVKSLRMSLHGAIRPHFAGERSRKAKYACTIGRQTCLAGRRRFHVVKQRGVLKSVVGGGGEVEHCRTGCAMHRCAPLPQK